MLLLTSTGRDLDAAPDPAFGRCSWFVLVDSATGEVSSAANPGSAAGGGAGVKAARFVVDANVDAVITGRVGPHAMEVLAAAGIRMFDLGGRDARRAVEDIGEGRLEPITSAAAPRGRCRGR